MQGTPHDWNTVVAGSWNLAILTPVGVVRKLFGLDPKTPVEIQVPLNATGPMMITHNGIRVVPSESHLVVEPVEPSIDGLRRAAGIARTAVDSLPETPFTAAGVNLRYRFDAIPDGLLAFLPSPLDDKLADQDFKILSRDLKRTVKWREGVLNIEAQFQADTSVADLTLNFHFATDKSPEIAAWFSRVDEMTTSAAELLQKTFGINGGDNK